MESLMAFLYQHWFVVVLCIMLVIEIAGGTNAYWDFQKTSGRQPTLLELLNHKYWVWSSDFVYAFSLILIGVGTIYCYLIGWTRSAVFGALVLAVLLAAAIQEGRRRYKVCDYSPT